MIVTRRAALPLIGAAIAVSRPCIPRAEAQVAETPIGSFDYVAATKLGGRTIGMRVFVNVPPGGVADRPILFVMHGVKRDADHYRDEWQELSNRYRVSVVVPEFSNEQFPRRENYNFGGVVDRTGKPRPRAGWHFQLIDQIFDDFVKRSGAQARTYDLYGHSAGAQFAHRFALLGGSARVRRIVMANAGSYSMPVLETPFPWGLGNIGLGAGDLTRILSLEGIVMLGDRDVDPNHPALPRDPEALEQGPHRFARGTKFFETLEGEARRRPFRFGWRKIIVPGVAHDNAGMAEAAAAALYGVTTR